MTEFTENDVKLALNELVELGELKIVCIDGEIYYVEPDWEVLKDTTNG